MFFFFFERVTRRYDPPHCRAILRWANGTDSRWHAFTCRKSRRRDFARTWTTYLIEPARYCGHSSAQVRVESAGEGEELVWESRGHVAVLQTKKVTSEKQTKQYIQRKEIEIRNRKKKYLFMFL
jgi:hypothetical protein